MAHVTTEYTPQELLTFLQMSGTIDIDDVAALMMEKKNKTILENHPYEISQNPKDKRWRTYIKEDGKPRRQIAKSSREKLEAALIEFYTGAAESKKEKVETLETLFPVWKEYKVLHRAAPTYISRIQDVWNVYYAHTDIVKIPIKDLDKLTVDIWIHRLIEMVGRSKKKYYRVSVVFRQILDYAVDAGIVSENVFRKVKVDGKIVFDPETKKPSETQVFSNAEVAALYEVAETEFREEHNRIHKLTPLAIMFQFCTGLRLGELVCIRYEDLREDEIQISRMYRFRQKEIITYTKGHSTGRYVILTKEAKHIIELARKYQQDNGLCSTGYIFSVNQEPLSYHSMMKAYTRYCKAIETIHKSSHKSRKTYISALIDGGVNINTVRSQVGHTSEKTTYQNYVYDRKTKPERVELIEKALAR